jgi:hypothetical protein
MIDDNIGRIFRDLACDVLEQEIEAMPAEEAKALSIECKREIMVKAVHQAFLAWNRTDRHLAIGRRAALRTGLAMRVDNSCGGVRPTRFPEGYEATIPSASGAPVQSYFEDALAASPTLIVEIPQHHSGAVQIMQLPPEATAQVTIAAPGAPLSLRLEEPQPQPPLQEEVGAFDGWSDEEERVFLEEEVSASESSSDEEEAEVYTRRSVRRRRWCLPGCDCERPIGTRKCACERTGAGLCDKHCACDAALCRSRPGPDADDE